MLVYTGTVRRFLSDCDHGDIESQVGKAVKARTGHSVSPSEKRSWRNSLREMALVLALSSSSVPKDAGVAIEYQVPLTSKRVDFMVSGYNAHEEPTIVVVELKQWEKVRAVQDSGTIVETYLGGTERPTVHPSYQAWSYAAFIENYNEAVQTRDIALRPCVYLHNYERRAPDPIDAPQYKEIIAAAPVFSKKQGPNLRQFLASHIARGDDRRILEYLEGAKLRPSRKLQDEIAGMLAGNRAYIMIDDQQVAFEEIADAAIKCQKDGIKRTLIIKGGPGTGKSVIAVNLLAYLTRKDQVAQYVTRSTTPRSVYLRTLKGNRLHTPVGLLFKGSSAYADAGLDSVQTVLVDEAHRLVRRSQYTKDNGRRNQVRELIHASRCSVFFLDESQRVTLQDIGSEEEIRKCAEEENAQVSVLSLQSQFRCNGSDGYLAWLDNTLQIRDTANTTLSGIDYDFRVFDSPNVLHSEIVKLNARDNNSARLVAGYCWEWAPKTRNDRDTPDIRIGDDFAMSWNLSSTSSYAYALDEFSINEAGCVHTVQGLEFAYVGVIIGDDLRYDGNRVVTDYTRRASTDQSLNGIKAMEKKDPEKAVRAADEIIRNTYRTLMTRGMKGCYIYCTDPKLREYFRQRI